MPVLEIKIESASAGARGTWAVGTGRVWFEFGFEFGFNEGKLPGPIDESELCEPSRACVLLVMLGRLGG